MIEAALHVISVIAYLAATVMLYRHLGRGVPGRGAVLAVALCAALAQGIGLGLTFRHEGALDFSFYHALSVVAFAVVTLVLLGALVRRTEVPGLVMFPVAALTVAAEWQLRSPPLLLAERNWQLNLHITLAVLAYALLSLAAAHALVLWVHESRLKRHRLAGVTSGLPPLASTEALLFQLITAGFSILTLTLVTGALFVHDLFAQHLVHKTVLSIVAWVVFGILLWGRWRHGWRGRTAAGWTLSGMAFLLLAYFGSKLVLELILHRTV